MDRRYLTEEVNHRLNRPPPSHEQLDAFYGVTTGTFAKLAKLEKISEKDEAKIPLPIAYRAEHQWRSQFSAWLNGVEVLVSDRAPTDVGDISASLEEHLRFDLVKPFLRYLRVRPRHLYAAFMRRSSDPAIRSALDVFRVAAQWNWGACRCSATAIYLATIYGERQHAIVRNLLLRVCAPLSDEESLEHMKALHLLVKQCHKISDGHETLSMTARETARAIYLHILLGRGDWPFKADLKTEIRERTMKPRDKRKFDGVEWSSDSYKRQRVGEESQLYKQLTAGQNLITVEQHNRERLWKCPPGHSGGKQTVESLNLTGVMGMTGDERLEGRRLIAAMKRPVNHYKAGELEITSTPFGKVESGIERRRLLPSDYDSGSVGEVVERNAAAVLSRQAYAQLYTTPTRTVALRTYLNWLCEKFWSFVSADASAWDEQHSASELETSTTQFAERTEPGPGSAATLETIKAYSVAHHSKLILSDKGTVVASVEGTLFSGEGPTSAYNTAAAQRCAKNACEGAAEEMDARVQSRNTGKGDDINGGQPSIAESYAMYQGLVKASVEMAPAKIQVETACLELERSVVQAGCWNHSVARRCGNCVCSEPQGSQKLTALELKQLAVDTREGFLRQSAPLLVANSVFEAMMATAELPWIRLGQNWDCPQSLGGMSISEADWMQRLLEGDGEAKVKRQAIPGYRLSLHKGCYDRLDKTACRDQLAAWEAEVLSKANVSRATARSEVWSILGSVLHTAVRLDARADEINSQNEKLKAHVNDESLQWEAVGTESLPKASMVSRLSALCEADIKRMRRCATNNEAVHPLTTGTAAFRQKMASLRLSSWASVCEHAGETKPARVAAAVLSAAGGENRAAAVAGMLKDGTAKSYLIDGVSVFKTKDSLKLDPEARSYMDSLLVHNAENMLLDGTANVDKTTGPFDFNLRMGLLCALAGSELLSKGAGDVLLSASLF